MPIAFVQDMPAAAEGYDAVVADMGLDVRPARGLILHTAGPFNGNWREIMIWESWEAWDTFHRERLMPALIHVLGEAVLSGAPPPEPQFMEVHNLIQGSGDPGPP